MKQFFAPLFIATLTACGGGSSGSNNDQTGQLTIGLTDAPVDAADAVVVSFNAITVDPAEGDAIEIAFDESMMIDVLAYQGDDRVLLLDGYDLPVGQYNWMRLSIVEGESYIEIDGQQFPLTIPSGSQSGLQLNRAFTIAAGTASDFTLDFDLRKSVRQQGNGQYRLRPTIRVVDNLEVGSISGNVDANLVNDTRCNNGDNNDVGNAVYFFSGEDQVVQDEQGSSGDPAFSASVNYDSELEAYNFLAGFVAPGDYTVSFTCDASLDDADTDDSEAMRFSEAFNVTVVAGENSELNFVVSEI